MFKYLILGPRDNEWSNAPVRKSWANFSDARIGRLNLSLDEALAQYKAKNCPGEPYVEFETEADALAFELIWG